MQINAALVVDEIREREDGSVDLVGLRTDLFFPTLPVLLERLSLFVDFEVEPADRGIRHNLFIRVVDPDGKSLKESPLRFTLPPDYPRRNAPLDPTLFEVPFHQYGPHVIEIHLRGVERVFRLPLEVYPPEETA